MVNSLPKANNTTHDFHRGDRVRFTGLKNEKYSQYNGREGRILKVQRSKGRLGVRFDFNGAEKKVSVKPVNLEKLEMTQVGSRSFSVPGGSVSNTTNENVRVELINNVLWVINADGEYHAPQVNEWLSYMLVGLLADIPCVSDWGSAVHELMGWVETNSVSELNTAFARTRLVE